MIVKFKLPVYKVPAWAEPNGRAIPALSERARMCDRTKLQANGFKRWQVLCRLVHSVNHES
jgi:hypothetical protein